MKVNSIESNKVFNVHNVPGDGNCFFYCLSFALHSNLTMSSTYRQTICNYILKNCEQFQHHIEIQKYSSLPYFQHMILGNGYATSLEIDFAALLLQKQINVWLECKILAVHPIFLQHFNHLLNQIIFKSIATQRSTFSILDTSCE